jgi:hypothetical protein
MIARVVIILDQDISAISATLEIHAMTTQDTAPETDDTGSNQPPTASQDTISEDLAQGYQFSIIVRPEGFTVGDPEPIAPEPQGEDAGDTQPETGESIPDRTGLVKAILGVLEAHPMGEEGSAPTGEQAKNQMAAGFDSSEKG